MSTDHISLELNFDNHSCVFYKEDINPRFKSKAADKLASKLKELMTSCQKSLWYTQELQKQADNKGVKPRSYAPGNQVWLNRKYIKIKQNCKLEFMFFWLIPSITSSKKTSLQARIS